MTQLQKPRTAVVTGADGALGSVVAEKFAQAGCEVIATYHSKAARPTKPARENIRWLAVDLSDPASVREAVRSAGEIDALVHCAGGFRYADADKSTDAELDFLLNANLRSTLLLVRELLPGMKTRGFGRIVLVSSRATFQPPAGMSAYAASKAGINAIVGAVAEEVKKLDININAVLPTVIDTPANRRDMPNADFSSWVDPRALAEIMFSLTQPWGKPIHGALIPVAGRI